jgi:capsular exopolysaccharide synthesis family protein
VVESHEENQVEAAESRRPAPRRNLLQIAWNHKRLVALGVIVGLGLASLWQMRRVPVYQSSAQVLVVKKHTDVLSTMGGSASVGVSDDYLSTHLVLIKSQVVVDRAVKTSDLGRLPSLRLEVNPTRAILASLASERAIKDPTPGADNIINLSYRGTDAEDAAAVLDAVINSYRAFLNETYQNFSGNSITILTQDHKKNEGLLVEKKKEYEAFLAKSPLLAYGNGGAQPPLLRLATLEGERLSLEMRTADIQEHLRTIEAARKNGQAREVVLAMLTARAAAGARSDKGAPPPSNTEGTYEQELLTLLLEEHTLAVQFGPDHPQAQALRKKIETARGLLAPEKKAMRVLLPGQEGGGGVALADAYVNSLKQELEDIGLTMKSMVPLTAAELQEAKRLTGYVNRDRDFQNEILNLQAQYDTSKKRLDEINLMREFGGYDALAISTPEPGVRVGLGLVQILLGGGLLGLLCGIGLAYLADVADTSFRDPEEIRRRLGLPIVGHIPIIDEKSAARAAEQAAEPAAHLDPSLAIHHRPGSAEAEAYRTVRTALYFSTRGGGHKVIQVTSPSLGDGKTTLAANLAVAIAQSGKRVVLVDADLRRPRVHQVFGLSCEVGLSSVIVGETDLAGALRESGVEGLSLLPSGPRPANPAELLTMPRFEGLIAELRDRFDIVVVDTPPLLAVTDACVVASRADGVLLTIRISKNGRPAAERAREILLSLQANVLGVVVNRVGKGAGRYGYDAYQYGYGYGPPPDGETAGSDGGPGGPPRGGPRKNGRDRRPAPAHRAPGWFGRLWR